MKYQPFFLYTNLRSLKRYLVNYKIQPSVFDGTVRFTLSDFGQNSLVFWRTEVTTETIRLYCKADANDIPVVLKVNLPSYIQVESFAKPAGIKQCALSGCSSAIAVKVNVPIPFFNVSSILYVDQPLVFLQGDTTQVIPRTLIDSDPYSPVNAIDDTTVSAVLTAFGLTTAFFDDDIDDDIDDDEETALVGAPNATDHMQTGNTIQQKSLIQDKIIASYAMFIQGRKPFCGVMTPRLYTTFASDGRSFCDYIGEVFYPQVDRRTIAACVRSSTIDQQYIEAFNDAVNNNDISNSLYGGAAYVLIHHVYTIDDRALFRDDFLATIHDDENYAKVSDAFADPRARSRLQELFADLPELIPIYFLYSFFDYGLDRFCENISEYELDATGYANVALSLWALLHGMNDIYSEYKPLNLLYALTCKTDDGLCIDYKTFLKLNHMKAHKGERLFHNLSCSYENVKIEYYFCVGNADQIIRELLDDLDNELSRIFDFRYAALRVALQSTSSSEVTRQEILTNKKTIHNRYLQLTEQSPQKQRSKKKKDAPIQPSFFDESGDNK